MLKPPDKHPGMPVYDGMTGQVVRKLGVGAPEEAAETLRLTGAFAVSADGRRVLTASSFGAALWDLTTGNVVAVLDKVDWTIHAAVFSPDSTRFVVAAKHKGYVFNAASGVLEATLVGHEGEVTAVAFSPDGTQVLTGSEDRTAARWRADTGRLEAVYMGHKAAVKFVAYRPDGQQVATATNDGEVRLWPLDPVAEVLRRAPRDLNEDERQRYELPAGGRPRE
jgi:WD40 repeat protein